MRRGICIAGLLAASLALFSACSAVAAPPHEFVPVGNAGNANDSTGFGAVDYDYSIGR